MVTNQESRESKSFRKVSKPLMEKKRRARINVSLEQLKSLLEKNYAQNIRKRKLEKADILELTVKYMKTLQSSLQVGVPVFRSAEYQAGFRHCLSSVSQFLLTSEEYSHTSPLALVRDLSMALPHAAVFRTKDSSCSNSNNASPANPKDQDTSASIMHHARTVIHPTKRETQKPSLCQTNPAHAQVALPNPNHSPSVLEVNRSPVQSVWRPW